MASQRLTGKVALITGGSRGIGAATARRLARDGAAVVVNYLSQPDAARRVAEEIRSGGGRALSIQADVANPDAVAQMIESCCRQLGPIDILVNNAGVLHKGDLLSSPDERQLDRMWEVNVKGVTHCTAAVVPSMVERKTGRIINLSSIAALGTNFPGTTFYAATKAAVLILTKRFALELGPHGISVNAICPGFIVTDMVTEGRTQEEIQKSVNMVSSRSMLQRPGKPEDIANVIAFLASDDSAFMTGQILTVDGGRVDFLTYST